ncbi:Ku protein [Ancylobacter sonchi]|uniref:non-homologous end joining protein Ku n=1 Tax=Ancylobacter sonchi TaxID=1937790 RepID=UPI001BD5A18F|nr:Ku protein [Ancylobacter sonchi]MBS7533383.1 Ku protein [Ancylobacter sonchi]
MAQTPTRAGWKGYLKLSEMVCAVSLYTAVSDSERVSLHMVNRRTGNRLQRRFVDSDTGKVVEREDQVKGYEVASGEYVTLEAEEIAAAFPKADKTLAIEHFIACCDIDDLYFDRPYYLRPSDEVSQPAFAVMREGLRRRKVAALATGVLFRRPRTLLVRAYDEGLIATTLNYDYEVKSAQDAFADIREVKVDDEMLDLARHIIKTKSGQFDPTSFEDRYEAALTELVRAKIAGRSIAPPKRKLAKVVDLMQALRESAGMAGRDTAAKAKGGRRKSTADTSKAPVKRAPARKAG